MAGDSGNILIGAAVIDIAGSDVGYTRGGASIKYSADFIDVDADQSVGIVRVARSMEKFTIEFSLLEVTLANLRLAMMFPSANLVGSTLTLGYNKSCWVDEVELTLTGPAPDCADRVFTFTRCVSKGEKEYAMKRDAAVEYKIMFEALKESDGTFGTIVDA